MPVTRHDLVRLRFEWQEWQMTFNGILDKLNTWNARQAKREKRALSPPKGAASETSAIPDKRALKLELSRRAAGGGFLSPPSREIPPPPDDGDDE